MRHFKYMKLDGTSFWDRIDQLLAMTKSNLTDMCTHLKLSYGSVNTQRTRHSIPKIEQLLDMSRYFGVSVESLLGVQQQDRTMNREAQAVNTDPDLQALVRAIQRDRSLLRAISAVVASYEDATPVSG